MNNSIVHIGLVLRFCSAKIIHFSKIKKRKMPSTKDFADFESFFYDFESRLQILRLIFADFESQMIDFITSLSLHEIYPLTEQN